MPRRSLLAGLVEVGRHIPGLRSIVLSRPVARTGYWVASSLGLAWGALLSGFHLTKREGVWVAHRLPKWAYGRGGTMVGGVFLTTDLLRPSVLRHEAIHREQWKRYGLAFPILYFAAGLDPRQNRFEIEAGLEDGGYLPSRHTR